MSDEVNDLLAWVVGIALFLVFAPPLGLLALRRIRHKLRRRLVDSPRKIVVPPASATAGSAGACAHQRSKSKARVDRDGSYVSICKRCGDRMKRKGPGQWEAV